MNAFEIRDVLHKIPEASGCEVKTKAFLMDYLGKVPGLKLCDCGKWFYALHDEGAAKSIAFRCDMDAVTGADGKPYHGCGHDGHMSVMTELAEWTADRSLGKNVYFIFQHAEESGEGGAECSKLLTEKSIDEAYAFHNCPGFEEGSVLMLKECFACASLGLIIGLQGSQSHAAYPENGRNSVFAITEIFSHWNEFLDPAEYRGMVLATPVEVNAGSRSFGVAAGSGEIGLTLRAWFTEDLKKLKEKVMSLSEDICSRQGIQCSFETVDEFPATENSKDLYQKVVDAAGKADLHIITPDEPFRWSEDFGWYGGKTKAFMLGIGAGRKAAGLHTPEYEWNDQVTLSAVRLFKKVIEL